MLEELLSSPSVGLSGCQSVCPAGELWKMAHWLWMPFGVVSWVSCGMGELYRVEIIKWEGTASEVNVRYPIVTKGDFIA